MRLLEVISRTRFQVFTFPKGTVSMEKMPIGAGSGFMLNYRNTLFFVTADHVAHPLDYKNEERQWRDQDMVIVNNYIEQNENGIPTPICTPIGNFYYFDKGHFDSKDISFETKPFDVTFCVMTEDRFSRPFKNIPFIVLNGEDVPGDLDMFSIPSEAIVLADHQHTYMVYGNTQFRLSPNDPSHLTWTPKLHEDLRYIGDNGDYYVLNPNYLVIDEEWMGISGAPVLDNEGGLIGILCGGNKDRNEIYVLKISHVTKLMDYTIDIDLRGNRTLSDIKI